MRQRKNNTNPKDGSVLKKSYFCRKNLMKIEQHITRLLFIIRTLQRFGKPVTILDLQKKLQENNYPDSKNTIKRDFDTIRILGFNIKYEHRTGYFIEGDRDTHVNRFLEEFELYTALESIKGFSDFIYPEQRRPNCIKHLQPIINAIRKIQYIQFQYHKYSNRNAGFLITDPLHNSYVFESLDGDTESLRIVAPYILKEFRGVWYLIGKDDKDKCIKTFALDRVSEVKNIGRKFTKDRSFNLAKKYRDCFGIYSPAEDSKVEEVILSFDAENGRYLKANPLHHSQTILIDTDEEFRISLRLYITLDFLQEILTRTWSLRIISPESLRLKVCETWEEALKRNEIL